ncbi:MAG TPA: hybrid sensor histidine kinase/response regulator [Stellaceae bacterium]|nr:hybrid sensor histidine kinase/response regulator [Stellaceae bacterium]
MARKAAGSARILAEQIVVLRRHLPLVLGANIAVAATVTTVTRIDKGQWTLFPWFAAILTITLLRMGLQYWSRASLGDPAFNKRLALLFTAASTLSGCIWGVLGIVGFATSEPAEALFVTLVLAGMTAGSVASLSAFPLAYYGYALPAMVPLILRFALMEGALAHAIALLGLMFLGVNLGYSRTMQRTLKDSIGLRFEREELVNDLMAEKARAERASQAKSKFLAATSHDLRQPVHAMGLLLDMMAQETSADARSRTAASIRSALDGLNGLLESFLDISKIEAGALHARMEPVPLRQVFTLLEHEFAPQAEARGLTFRVVGSDAVIETDLVMLLRILRNLVANALSYTPQGAVIVGCRSTGPGDSAPSLRIEVRDSGVGIPAERHKNIFQEFYRIDVVPAARRQGIGLGLAIVDGLARAIGAEIAVRSAPGKGSVFSVAVPRIVHTLDLPDRPLPDAATRFDGKRILIVDDDPLILAALDQLIRRWGAEVTACGDAAEAIALTEAAPAPPDAILADYRLEQGTNGVELISTLNQLLKRIIPAAIITGDINPLELEAAGPGTLLLHKPVSPAKLRATLTALLE